MSMKSTVAERLERRVLFSAWTAVEQINHSYGSGKLSGGVDIDVSPVTKLPVVVMHSLAQGTQDYVIQVDKGVRRADGTIDWSGTRNNPIEAEPRGHKDQNPALSIGTTTGGLETLNVVYFEHDGGSTLGASATEDVMFVRSTNGGASWTAPFNVSAQAVGDSTRVASDPDVAADDQGNAYVVWANWSGYASGNNLDIWFRKFNAATQLWEAAKKIESNPASKSDFPQIFWVPGTQRLHVAWGDRALSPPPLSYAMSSDGGATFTAPQTVFTAPGTYDVRGATVTETADGTVLAAATITDPSNSNNKNTYMAYKPPGSGTWQPAGGDSVSGTSPSASQYFTADRSGRTYLSWIKNPYPGTGYEFNFRYQDGAAATNFDGAANTQVSSDGWKKDSGHVAVDTRATAPGYVYGAWEANPGTHEVYAAMTKLTPPTAAFDPIAGGPSSVASATVTFSDYVVNVDAGDFLLTRNGSPVSLSGVTVWTADNKTFTLSGLSSATAAPSMYVLSIAGNTNITDVFSNAVAAGAMVTWTNNSLPAWLGAGSVATWDASTHALNVTGAATIIADPGADSPAVTVSGASAVLTVNPGSATVVTLASLALANGGHATVAAHGAGAVRTLVLSTGGNPSIDATGSLDLADNAMVVKNGSVASLQTAIAAGFQGHWQGVGGVTSTTAASDPAGATALGFGSNAVLGRTTFAGVSGLTPGDVLVRYTYAGDADLSGATSVDDFTLFLHGYQGGGTSWVAGDFDYGGGVTLDDFTLFLAGYQKQGPPL
jgi:hypothetical protein